LTKLSIELGVLLFGTAEWYRKFSSDNVCYCTFSRVLFLQTWLYFDYLCTLYAVSRWFVEAFRLNDPQLTT